MKWRFACSFSRRRRKSKNLYWRGPVLWDFDGRTWSMGGASTTATGGVTHEGLKRADQATP